DVPMTQSQPIESTKGTHRTLSAPRSPNHETDEGELSAPQKSTVIRLCIPQRRSTRLTPPTPILTTVEHLIAEEIEKLVEGAKNVENVKDDISNLRQDDTQNISSTRLEPMSDKESLEVVTTTELQPVNINEEEEESAEDDYELKRREKWNHVEELRHKPSHTTTRSPRIHSTLISSNTKKLRELMVNDPPPSSSTPSSSLFKIAATNRLLSLFTPKTGCFK
ncbi:hypothetical protein Tco_1157336, partial [Tanacetum coccineum]